MHLYCMENTISQIAIRGRTVPRLRPANAGHPHGGTSIRAAIGCSSPLHIVPTGDGNDVVVGRVQQRIHRHPYDLGVDPGTPDLDLRAPVDGVSSFRGGASGLKKRGVPTLSRKRDASRPERKPTRVFATTMLHHTLLATSAVRPQVARSTGRSSPALNGGFADPGGRPVGGAHKTPRRANRGRKPHQSPITRNLRFLVSSQKLRF